MQKLSVNCWNSCVFKDVFDAVCIGKKFWGGSLMAFVALYARKENVGELGVFILMLTACLIIEKNIGMVVGSAL
jgi:hypothetical protein